MIIKRNASNKIDFNLLGVIIALSIIGILFIYSSQVGDTRSIPLYLKQGLYFFTGLILYFLVSRIDYHTYFNYSMVIYIFGIILLFFVLVFGVTVHGSKSWINLGFIYLEPAEIVKIAYIIILSSFAIYFRDNIDKISFFFMLLLISAPYFLLIILQPDFGTLCMFLLIFLGMFFICGGNIYIISFLTPIFIISLSIPLIGFFLTHHLPIKHTILGVLFFSIKSYLIVIAITLVFLFIFGFLYYFLNKKVFLILGIVLTIFIAGLLGSSVVKTALKDYHFQRILTVFDPSMDPKGKGYNINQSLIAIGSGKILGSGLGKGSQNLGNFLPAKHTDFILAVLAQEWGFVGVLLLITLNVMLVVIIFQTAKEANDFVGFSLTSGIGVLFASHFLINVFSTIGFFPVIGITLPFVSYGGSSVISNFVALGIVANIRQSRYLGNI